MDRFPRMTEPETGPVDLCDALVRSQAQAEYYRQLFEAQPVPTLVLDAAGQLLRANGVAACWLGLEPASLPACASGHDPGLLLKALEDADSRALVNALREAGPGQTRRLGDLWLRAAGQQVRRIDILVRCLPDAPAPDSRLLVQLHERAEEGGPQPVPPPSCGYAGDALAPGANPCQVCLKGAAECDQHMSEVVFLNSHEAIIVMDVSGHYRRVNPAFERMTGFSSAQVQGRFVKLLLALEDEQDDLEQEALASIHERGQWTGEALHRTADGRRLAVRCSVTALIDESGQLQGHMAILSDLSELRRASDEIARLATTDSLTGLPNRALFHDRLQQALSQAKRRGQSFALLFADLDYFKEVNDTLGHSVGDELLVVIAHRLRDSVRDMDTVARLGGDEFVMLLPNIGREDAVELADRLLQHLQQPMALDGLPDYRAQASVGLVMYPEHGTSLDILMRNADQAMYAAKRGGRNQLRAYTADMGVSSQAVFSLHRELRTALEHKQLEVHLQPKFRLLDMAVVGAEALIRWQHPELGLLSCCDFLYVAEQHQLLGAIDSWVLQTTLSQLADWAAQGRWPDDWTISVNQSASDVQQSYWLSQLDELLRAPHLKARWLDIELTEAVWARPTPELLERLRQFRALGVSLSIDDFGTGYSSLSCLKQLPVTGVKIDQSFVHGMLEHEGDRVLVETIIELVRRLKLGLLAEGVETEPHRELLLQMGCPLGQGYLLCGPLPLAEFGRRFLPPKAGARSARA